MGTTTSGETIFVLFTDFIEAKNDVPKLITSSDYTKQVILKGRPVLSIEYLVTIDNDKTVTYKITMLDGDKNNKNTNSVVIIYKKITNNILTIVTKDIKGISLGFLPVTQFENVYTPFIKLSEGAPFDKCKYKIGDEYILQFGKTPENNPTIQITFSRSNRIDINDKCIYVSNQKEKNNNIINEIIVPSITINFQSLIDGSDIGNTIFTIIDEVDYYHGKTTKIYNNYCCKTMITDNPKTTLFDESCPLIVNVLDGIGKNAYEKIIYLIQNRNTGFNDVYDFGLTLVKYSMLKYILSRLMYGDFNTKYILNKWNNKFLKDLSNTRFCKFVNEFTDPNSDIFGFDKYFL